MSVRVLGWFIGLETLFVGGWVVHERNKADNLRNIIEDMQREREEQNIDDLLQQIKELRRQNLNLLAKNDDIQENYTNLAKTYNLLRERIDTESFDKELELRQLLQETVNLFYQYNEQSMQGSYDVKCYAIDSESLHDRIQNALIEEYPWQKMQVLEEINRFYRGGV